VNNNLQFDQLVELFRLTHQETQYRASRTVDTYLVVRNWLFGWYIVEFENGNAGHAELYGQALMMKLAKELGNPQIKGISITSLKHRRFYSAYKLVDKTASMMTFEEEKMRQALSASSSLTLPFNAMREFIAQLMPCFTLGWSHYVTLLTIDNSSERRFYEIEATANSWSVRELERQIASSLYERLALSRNKDEIRQLAEQGLVIEKAADHQKSIRVGVSGVGRESWLFRI